MCMDRKIVIIADRDWIGESDMREIIFKAKRKYNGEWVEGYYAMLGVGDIVRHYIIQNCAVAKLFEKPEDNMYFNDIEIDPDTLCQYTGLTDKNGRKIWENDIVKHKDSQCFGIIRWYCGDYVGWCVYDVYDDEQQFTMDMLNECEVIGNIFDNEELLEVE